MKRKYLLWGLLIVVLAAAAYGYKEFNRTRPDSKSLEAGFTVSAEGILKEFAENEKVTAQKYSGQELIVAVSGTVKDIKKDEKGYYTLMLGDSSNMSSVQCAMDTLYSADLSSIKIADKITVKGHFTGYNADETGLVGSDIQMNMCVIELPKKQ